MSSLYSFRKFDPKTSQSSRILGFRFFFAFRRTQNSNSGGHKTRIFIYKVSVALLPWIKLIYIKTNAKEQQICPSVSIQKRALKLVLFPPEWKKGRSLSVFALVDTIKHKCKRTTNQSQCKHPKRPLRLVLCPPEWKKGIVFFFFCFCPFELNKGGYIIFIEFLCGSPSSLIVGVCEKTNIACFIFILGNSTLQPN